jgi:hypothetical protein
MLHIIGIMMNFKKDRVSLLAALKSFVQEGLEHASVAPMDEEIAELVIELTDRRRTRKLKKINEALKEWISEMVREEKLRKEERQYNEEVLAKLHRSDAIRAESHQ